jgi:hypothetical protein
MLEDSKGTVGLEFVHKGCKKPCQLQSQAGCCPVKSCQEIRPSQDFHLLRKVDGTG